MSSATLPQPDSIQTYGITRWEKLFLTVSCILCTTQFKYAGIQLLEILFFLQFAWFAVRLSRRGYAIVLDRTLARFTLLYILLTLVIIFLAAVALTRPFYVPIYMGGFYRDPGALTAARLIEFILCIGVTVYIARVCQRSVALCVYLMRVYFWAGFASAIYSIVSFFIALVTPYQFGVYLGLRFRGFFTEGGPYGLYLLSVFMVALALRHVGVFRRHFWLRLAPVFISFAGSQSKAGLLAAAIFLVTAILLTPGMKKKIAIVVVFAIGGVLALRYTRLFIGIEGYRELGRRYEVLSEMRPTDLRLNYGRTASLFYVPRMTAAHPWSGVGFGNYPIVRNDPRYRGLASPVVYYDISGIGILLYPAELGLPVFVFLVLMQAFAFFSARAHRCGTVLSLLGLMQLYAGFNGAQLNIVYPWIVSAFTLALIAHKAGEADVHPHAENILPGGSQNALPA